MRPVELSSDGSRTSVSMALAGRAFKIEEWLIPIMTRSGFGCSDACLIYSRIQYRTHIDPCKSYLFEGVYLACRRFLGVEPRLRLDQGRSRSVNDLLWSSQWPWSHWPGTARGSEKKGNGCACRIHLEVCSVVWERLRKRSSDDAW